MNRPIFVMLVVSLALTIGGAILSLWNLGDVIGARYGLSGLEGLAALDPVFREAAGLDDLDYYPWYPPPLAIWAVIIGVVLLTASIALAAALWRPRPRPRRQAKREAAVS